MPHSAKCKPFTIKPKNPQAYAADFFIRKAVFPLNKGSSLYEKIS